MLLDPAFLPHGFQQRLCSLHSRQPFCSEDRPHEGARQPRACEPWRINAMSGRVASCSRRRGTDSDFVVPTIVASAVACSASRRRRRCFIRAKQASQLRTSALSEEAQAQKEAFETFSAAAQKAPSRKAAVAKQVNDVVIAVTATIGESAHDRMPDVGDVVEFSGGAIGYVIALSDLCFAAALNVPTDTVAPGESYKIRPKSFRPSVVVPKVGGLLVDAAGRNLDAAIQPDQPNETTEEDVEKKCWFNEMVSINRRQRIDSPLHSGVMGLDSFLPIGRGQSMLLRLPPDVVPEQLKQYFTHILEAQGGSNVRCCVAMPTVEEGEEFRQRLKDTSAAQNVIVVAGLSEKAQLGEAILAMNSACAVAESHRDHGGDSLVLLDLEPLYRVWKLLDDFSQSEGLTEIANEDQNQEINKLTDDLGVELWKYVARKNAVSARRRTFLGCFLQRASRVAADHGGGSMTMLAFGRLKDESKLTRLDLEAKLASMRQMHLNEDMRERAIAKLEQQIAELPEDGDGDGVADDFLEEAKAVTDGHVVFANGSGGGGGKPRWCVDLKESVARGITADSVQNRPLHLLASLRFKMYLMHREEQETDIDGEGIKLDSSPLLALLQQPVGDVLQVEDEAALFLLALNEAASAKAARPLAEEAFALLVRGQVRMDDEIAKKQLTATVWAWAEAVCQQVSQTASLKDLDYEAVEVLIESLDLRPLEKKRVLAIATGGSTVEDNSTDAATAPVALEGGSARYASLRARVWELRAFHSDELSAVAETSSRSSRDDNAVRAALATLQQCIDAPEVEETAVGA